MKEVLLELGVKAKETLDASDIKIIWALVIDDNVFDRGLRKRNFESMGCKVDVAECGEAAIERIQSRRELGEAVYAFISCDYEMGTDKKTGAQTVCDIKKIKEYEETIIWCMSSKIEQMRREIFEGLDANGQSDLFTTLRFTNKDPKAEIRKRSLPVTANEIAAVDPLTETLLEGSHGSTRRHSAPPQVESQVEKCLPKCSIL